MLLQDLQDIYAICAKSAEKQSAFVYTLLRIKLALIGKEFDECIEAIEEVLSDAYELMIEAKYTDIQFAIMKSTCCIVINHMEEMQIQEKDSIITALDTFLK